MELVEVGVVARPHGYRGAFVVSHSAGRESALKELPQLWVGSTPDNAIPHKIHEASWMPSGWKLHIDGITSEEEVKALRGQKVYVNREDFPELDDNEYYLHDLLGAEVVDVDREVVIGHFEGIEGEGKAQWWKIKSSTGEKLIPPKRHFIDSVNTKTKQIRLRNLGELP